MGCPENPRIKSAKEFEKGKPNPLVNLWVPLSSDATNVYNHAILRNWRGKSDCQPECPKADVWQYQYGTETSPQAIATLKKHWKVPFEARIISTTLFGSNPKYLRGLKYFLDSNDALKKFNHITESLWGYETFIYRVYVAKSKDPNKIISNATPDAFIDELLKLGCEIAYVDNGKDVVKLDATFWRFMIMAESMPDGQPLRYLVRDVDWLVTGAEAFAVSEWINSGQQFHRAQILPTCIGPIQGGLWGGYHVGRDSPFLDMKDYIERYPYRLFYGDDEAFLRDMVWPRMQYKGSILTHHYPDGFATMMSTPYEDSCARPTQPHCDEIKTGGQCNDVILPSDVPYPYIELGAMDDNEKLLERSHIFDMHLDNARAQKAAKGLSKNPDFP